MTQNESTSAGAAPSFTRMLLTDLEDTAPADSGMQIRFARAALGAEQAGLTFHQLGPNVRQRFGHRHDRAEELHVVVGGSGRMKLDDEIIELEPLVAVRVSPQVMRSFAAGPDGLQWIVAGAHHPRDGELVQEWWTD
jgi:mannose-6-phosphate isomerase-like protein (cupin superfamily)